MVVKHVYPLRRVLPEVQTSPRGFIQTNPKTIIRALNIKPNLTAEELVLRNIQMARQTPEYASAGPGFDPRRVDKPGAYDVFGHRYGFTIHGRSLVERPHLQYRCSLDF